MNRVWAVILVAGAGTYAMRSSFLAVAHRLAEVPPWLSRILRQIPPAAMAAIVVPALLRPYGEFDLFQVRLLAGIAAAAVAWKTRNVGLTLVAGMGILVLLEAL